MADFQIKPLETYEYDVRLVDRHLRKGRVKHSEYQKYLSGLTDGADNAVVIEARLCDEDVAAPDETDEA